MVTAPRNNPRPTGYAPDAAKMASRLAPEQRDERAFIKSAAAVSRFEADASKLALAKSSHSGLRALAAELINHHKSASVELQYLLHVRGMAMPMLDNEDRKVLNQLGKLSGARFDREYMEQVGLRYQREDIRLYEKAILTAADPTLKSWLERQLPTRRYHLLTAERVDLPAVNKVALPASGAHPVSGKVAQSAKGAAPAAYRAVQSGKGAAPASTAAQAAKGQSARSAGAPAAKVAAQATSVRRLTPPPAAAPQPVAARARSPTQSAGAGPAAPGAARRVPADL